MRRSLLLGGLVLLLVAITPARAQQARDRAMVYLFWNDDYLYLAAQVDDENVVGRYQGLMQPVWDDDSIALYFEVNRARAQQPTSASFLVAASAAGGITVLRGQGAGWDQHRALGQFKFERKVQGTLNHPGDIDSGYTVEMGIPWTTLDGRPREGTTIGFNLVIFQRGDADRFVSASPQVQSEEDLAVPAKWTQLVFQRDLTLQADTQSAILCPRWDQVPLVDGTLKPAEWPLTSVFLLPYTPESRRVAQPPGTRAAPGEPLLVPPLEPQVAPPVAPEELSPYRGERYVLAPYVFDYQGDLRAPWPARQVRYRDGSLQISEKPMEGAGPWFSTLRVAWHRQQLEQARDADIEVLLPLYSADARSRREWSGPGLRALVSALRELRRSGLADPLEGRDYPLLGLALQVDSLAAEVSPLDLRSPVGQEALWRAIREYFWQVPADLWAVVSLPERQLVPIYLTEPRAVQDIDPACLDYCQQRFQATFGLGILWLGHSRWARRGVTQMDGYADLIGGLQAGWWEQGAMRVGVVGPGYNNLRAPGEAFQLRPRDGTLTMKRDAAQVLARQPDWLIIDSWNDFVHGNQVAPSRENGLLYVDTASLVAFQFNGARERDAKFLGHNVPELLAPGQEYYVELRIANTGFGHWREEQGISLGSRWLREGEVVGEGPRTWILSSLSRGVSRAFVTRIRTFKDERTPLEPGRYELRFGMVAGAEGWFSQAGDRDLLVPVEIGAPPTYRASVLTTLAPTSMASGGRRPVRVWVRNDGGRKWEQVRLRYVWERVDSPLTGAEDAWRVAVGEAVDFPETEVGQVNSLAVELKVVDDEGVPLPPLADPHQHYLLRWELLPPDGPPMPLAHPWQDEVQVLEEEPGILFLRGAFEGPFQAGRTGLAALRLFNNSAAPWRPGDLSLGYHWYFWDGVEAVWDDGQRMPLAEEVAPGQGINVTLPVRCPPGAGSYVIVIDALWKGEEWVSHLPSTSSRDLLVEYLRVGNDRFVHLDLERRFNLDGMSSETDRSDGDFDGRGNTFPTEEMPPDVPRSEGGLYPSGYWGPVLQGLDWNPREVPFLYPSKAIGGRNFVACSGQTVPVPRGRYRRLHILAAAAPDPAAGRWTLHYWPREQESQSLRVSHWNGPPEPEDLVGFLTLHTHSLRGENPQRRGYLYHYTLPVNPRLPLQRIQLPDERRIKVMALTLER